MQAGTPHCKVADNITKACTQAFSGISSCLAKPHLDK
jgi:hypothetical protein